METPEQNAERTREFYERLMNQHDMAAMEEYLTPDFVDHNPPPNVEPGMAGVKQTMSQFLSAFPDMAVTVEEMIATDDKVVSRITLTGTHQGEFMGIAPTGNRIVYPGIDIVRIEGDKAAERWGYFDDVGLLQQLGVAPPIGG